MDPIANLLVQLSNSQAVHKDKIIVPGSKLKEAILGIIKKHGYVGEVKPILKNNKKYLQVSLLYHGKDPAITKLKKISTPGRRIYKSWKNIPRSMGGYGMIIVSSSQGLLTDQEARKKRIGGELICEVY